MKKNLIAFAVALTLASTVSFAQTWTPQTSGTTQNLWSIQFVTASTGYASGNAGTVLKTTDGGLSWTSVSINTTNPVRSISFIDANTGWAAVGDPGNASSSGSIWMTVNGGTTWSPQTPSTTEARLGISMVSSTNGWACGSRNGPLNIDATVNGGTNWTNQSDANIFGWVYDIDGVSSTSAFTVGGAFFPSVTGLIISTSNAGTTWSLANTGTIPFMYGIDMFSSTNGFAVGEQGAIMSTVDGVAWSPQTSTTTNILRGVSFISATAGWVTGENGTILGTTNGGTSWSSEVSGTQTHLNAVYAFDMDNVWTVGDSGTIRKRTTAAGIEQHNLTTVFDLNVYPNPMRDEAKIFLPPSAELLNETILVSIIDIAGREVRTSQIPYSPQILIERGELEAGSYFVRIIHDNALIGEGKFIVQ